MPLIQFRFLLLLARVIFKEYGPPCLFRQVALYYVISDLVNYDA